MWTLVHARRGLLTLGAVLIAINRLAGLVLPASTKVLIDDVIGARRGELLWTLVGAVVAATLVQGVTSFVLTQTLSKAAQRLIADLRRQVQAHVSRLPIAFYDSQKTGTLVSRVMNDVEGVRNLVGTGLVELLGGFVAAVGAFVLMVRLSPVMTGVTVGTLLVFGVVLGRAFAVMGPIFKERSEIHGETSPGA
jgi:subfamily B ATP-binding cassette protein MsbA